MDYSDKHSEETHKEHSKRSKAGSKSKALESMKSDTSYIHKGKDRRREIIKRLSK